MINISNRKDPFVGAFGLVFGWIHRNAKGGEANSKAYCKFVKLDLGVKECRMHQLNKKCWSHCLECSRRTYDEYGTRLPIETLDNNK